MTQTPDDDDTTPLPPPPGPPADPPRPHGDPLAGQAPPPPPGWQQPPGQPYPPYQQPWQGGYDPTGYGQQYAQQGYDPAAPYGIHPGTGLPYSDKSKLVAGLLQVLLPLGIGRMYIGQTGLGVAQLLVTVFTCGIGAIWPFIDGILILVRDEKDAQGRILRP